MKILTLFGLSKEDKEKKEQIRVGKALSRGQEALIDSLEARKDAAQDTIDKLVEGKLSNINKDTFNATYHEAKLEIIMMDKEIEVAKAVQTELYTDESKA